MSASQLLRYGAIGVAAWALVMAWPQHKETAQPSAESKQKVCAAFYTVSRAVQLQTHADLGPDGRFDLSEVAEYPHATGLIRSSFPGQSWE